MKKQGSNRIAAYDFFQGIILLGLLMLTTLFILTPSFLTGEIFLRWALLGFLFFFGIIAGEVLSERKPNIFFVRRGIQILGIFLVLNFLFLPTQNFSLSEFSLFVIQGTPLFVASLLFPLGCFFLSVPIIRHIPPTLGMFWSLLGFFAMDIFFLHFHFFVYNLPLFLSAFFGFFMGKTFSLNRIRENFHHAFSFLPFLSFYLAFLLLVLPKIFSSPFLTSITHLWSFHLCILILFFFSIPALFEKNKEQKKTPLRQFLETLGVEPLFIYLFFSLIFQIFSFFPSFFLDNAIMVMTIFVHISILCFLVIFLLKKWMHKQKKLDDIFRFLF